MLLGLVLIIRLYAPNVLLVVWFCVYMVYDKQCSQSKHYKEGDEATSVIRALWFGFIEAVEFVLCNL